MGQGPFQILCINRGIIYYLLVSSALRLLSHIRYLVRLDLLAAGDSCMRCTPKHTDGELFGRFLLTQWRHDAAAATAPWNRRISLLLCDPFPVSPGFGVPAQLVARSINDLRFAHHHGTNPTLPNLAGVASEHSFIRLPSTYDITSVTDAA